MSTSTCFLAVLSMLLSVGEQSSYNGVTGGIIGGDEELRISQAGIAIFIFVAKVSLKSKHILDSTPKYACISLCLIILRVVLLLLATHFVSQI